MVLEAKGGVGVKVEMACVITRGPRAKQKL